MYSCNLTAKIKQVLCNNIWR